MRGISWWVAAALLVLPLASASAPQFLDVQARLSSMDLDRASDLVLAAGLFQVDFPVDHATRVEFGGARVVATQYWMNVTSVVDPASGAVLYRVSEPSATRPLPVRATAMSLLVPNGEAQVRALLASGAAAHGVERLQMDALAPADRLGDAHAYAQTRLTIAQSFGVPPPASGWMQFGVDGVASSGPTRYLVDGWNVRLEAPDASVDLQLGHGHGNSHPFGFGGHIQEVYTFLVLEVDAAAQSWSPGATLRGYGSSPQVAWDGPAHFKVQEGGIDAGGLHVSLGQREFDLVGSFRASVGYGPDAGFMGAPMHAFGTGVSSIPLASSGTGLIPAQQFGVWATVAIGALTVGVLGVQTYRSPRRLGLAPPAHATAAPTPREPIALGELIEHAQKRPLDGELQFRLGVELFRVGRADIGLRALDRSFRLHPPAIVRLLEDPELASIRETHEIRQLLGRFQKEQHRKVWAGYA